MSIPLATTTISVLRPTAAQDAGEAYQVDAPAPGGYRTTATGIRAHIGSPGGSETVRGSEQMVGQFGFLCDPVDMDHYSWVRDEKTGSTYQVIWVKSRTGFGPSFMQGQLKRVEGS